MAMCPGSTGCKDTGYTGGTIGCYGSFYGSCCCMACPSGCTFCWGGHGGVPV